MIVSWTHAHLVVNFQQHELQPDRFVHRPVFASVDNNLPRVGEYLARSGNNGILLLYVSQEQCANAALPSIQIQHMMRLLSLRVAVLWLCVTVNSRVGTHIQMSVNQCWHSVTSVTSVTTQPTLSAAVTRLRCSTVLPCSGCSKEGGGIMGVTTGWASCIKYQLQLATSDFQRQKRSVIPLLYMRRPQGVIARTPMTPPPGEF